MLGELGQFTLVLALILSIVQFVIPLVGLQKNNTAMLHFARSATYAQFLIVALSYAILTYGFYLNDFSISYVANTSNLQQPLVYRLSGVWGGHEGSLLLWLLMLSGWSALVARFSRNIPLEMIARVLSILGFVSIGFVAFTLFTSSPFERIFPVPLDGRELNPLLQDFGFLIHPPMLYMGYVGFSVAFAFAIAAILGGKLDTAWARWSRPWTLMAWLFLTIGIVLGSWWAYYELGWGGWWFWDPVENASFMPWLVGTALIHSLSVTEKRSAFKAWTALLAILAFSLSLLGTFLVRSGVLTSVHSFASDPTRGLFILAFLVVVIGGSLTLFAAKAHTFTSSTKFKTFSKESALFTNNVLLMSAAFMVLVGTLYPLIIDALTGQKLSVGPPYFDSMFAILTIPLAVIVGIGSMSRWKQDHPSRFITPSLVILTVSMLSSAAFTTMLSLEEFKWSGFLGLTLGIWVLIWSLNAGFERLKFQSDKLNAIRTTPASTWGMMVAHIGLAVFIIGVTHVNVYSLEKDIKLNPGETYELGGYEFRFDGVRQKREANYTAQEGKFMVSFAGQKNELNLYPQKRFYSSGNPMTEAAIDTTLSRDLYVSLGEPIDKGSWSVRIYIRSFVACIWLGGFFMALGALIACFDKRYRIPKVVKKEA